MTRSATTRTRLTRNRAVTIAAALLAVIAGLGTSTASAASTHTRPAHTAARAVLAAEHGQLNDEAGEQGVCATCAPPLAYTTGNPVMGTTSGTVTITPIWWAPQGYDYTTADTYSSNYQPIINKFITDVAAASSTTAGRNSDVFGILPEYSQTVNGVTTNIKYSIKAGASYNDTDAYPTTGQCTITPYPNSVNAPLDTAYTACITDAQLQTELSSYITAKNLPTGLDNLYAVLLPPYVQTQLGTGATASYSMNAFCGYHSAFKMGGNTVVYANEPFAVAGDCGYASTPNADPYADVEVSILSHEISEAMTDPVGLTLSTSSWRDKTGNEIGDECAYNYGLPVGTVQTAYGAMSYNQVINGDYYYLQTEFSNAAYKATGIGTGCRQTPYVLNMRPRHGIRHDQSGMATALTVDPSPASLPADGTSTSTVTITATDANGNPVAGDSVSVFTHDDNATPADSDDSAPAGCGTLSNGGADPGNSLTTNAAGQVSVTYTASTISSDCYVMATDATAGITDQAVIYQGSDQPAAPAITQSTLPSQLVSGGAAATFTASATNPAKANGGSDIADARFGVYITGDDNASTGINASQLTLTYKDDATQGDYVTVPLTGTTTDGGQISGLVSPDTAEALAAGNTRNATFQLSLAGNAAADTATTGNNLQIQITLDQIDPADGSLSNLDMTTPGDVPVTQEPGDTITYSGKLVTISPPSGSTPGTAVLEAKACTFTSDHAACRLTGTASFTASGGTLTGTITTDPAAGVPDLVINFTETFTTSPGGGTGTGTGQVIYFDNGNSSTQNLSTTYQTSQDKTNPNIQETQGTLTFTNPTP